jgi:hypothetical protein
MLVILHHVMSLIFRIVIAHPLGEANLRYWLSGWLRDGPQSMTIAENYIVLLLSHISFRLF